MAVHDPELRTRTLKAAHRLLVVALWALAIWAVWQVKEVAIPLVIAVLIASVTIPPTNRLIRRGMNPAAATAIVWLTLIAAGTVLVLLLVPPTISGFSQLAESFDSFTVTIQDLAGRFGLDEARIAEYTRQGRDWIAGHSSNIAGGALTGVIATGEVLVGAVLAFVLAIYFTHGGNRLVGWLAELLPPSVRGGLHDGAEVVFDVMGRYVRGVAIVGFVDGFFIGLALWILGVPIAVPLAVLTWVGAFLPLVGAFLAGTLAAIVAFVAKGWVVALIVVGVTVAVQQIEGHILAPQIYGRALALPGAVILLAIALGSAVAGIAGAFLAAPIASVTVALLRRARHRAEAAEHPDAVGESGATAAEA
ncbi:putative PurR-regulated permease PerM [Actinocorallia herbida]|uniref:Putative PurR-regulated permease PerM n=1 Tax=Actinocorallia herbida TaxID=58109 RepID=A0A3N1CUF3_9ACTN|nr:AI-2E family transporter [Actinocorallia herbida]ROO84318.1 putative PurR-regulated permease PerM [Actinocorallia herbida]